MSNKWTKRALFGLIFFALTFVFGADFVFAGNEGGSIGGDGEYVCTGSNVFLSTCYGAEWRHYDWGESATNVSYSNDTIYIGTYGGAGDFAKSATLTGCRDAGGYWRYAMVAAMSYYGYNKGDQVGVIGIGGGDIDYRSQNLGGNMVNRNQSSWSRASTVYKAYREIDPDTYKRGWGAESDLAWFCGGYNPPELNVTLTGKAIDKDGNDLPLDDVSETVKKNNRASVTNKDALFGYTFIGWRDSRNGEITVKNNAYTVESLGEDKTVYAVYEADTFRGSVKIIESSTNRESGTGMVSNSATANTLYIKCVKNSGECNIKLDFEIERVTGLGSTTYTAPNDNLDYVSGSTVGGRVTTDKSHRLNLGENKCYTLTFNTRPSLGDNGKATLKVCAATPYNFQNTVKISDNGATVVNPGEPLSGIKATIKTETRHNSAIGQTYATEVPNASYDIEVQVEGTSGWTSLLNSDETSKTHTLNNGNNNAGGSERNVSANNYIVPDVPAGSRICVRAWVKPKDSGAATNIDKNGFDYGTNSDTKCFIVAKKPTIDVLGGGMYAARDVETSVSEKSKLNGYSDYAVRVYGSFAEHSLNALGSVKGFSSGAATGAVEGSKEDGKSDFCLYRTPLTLANYADGKCEEVGYSGVYRSGAVRDEILAFWQDKEGVYTRFDGDADIDSGTIGNTAQNRFLHVQGNATIKNDIIIGSGSGFSSVTQIPKIIIYAEKSVKIDCSVQRIDAIIVAKNGVNTCENYSSDGEVSSDVEKRSKLLTINGTIISDYLTPSRVGGAGAGNQSNVPAEIINYDTSILLWEKALSEGDNKNNNNLVTVYQTELAPRY